MSSDGQQEKESYNSAGLPSQAVDHIKIGIIGCGSFATAMATIAARKGHSVTMWTRDEEQARIMNEKHKNSKYLQEFILPERYSS